jgi:hypothetical protein
VAGRSRHLSKLYHSNVHQKNWFCQRLTVDDTTKPDKDGNQVPVVSNNHIEDLRRQGKDEAFIRREYYVDFDAVQTGSIWGKWLDACAVEKRIRDVPYDPALPVHTAWDLGAGKSRTVIIFFQTFLYEVRVIDCYAASGEGFKFYAQVLRDKLYTYGTHYAPWDINFKGMDEEASKRIEIAAQCGIKFRKIQRHAVEDRLEAGRAIIPRCFFDQSKCEIETKLLEGLRGYSRNYDEQNDVYTSPKKDWCSDFADAFGYMCHAIFKPTSDLFVMQSSSAADHELKDWPI